MHEFSIAENLVNSVLEEIANTSPQPKQIIQVNVVIGQLRQIIPDYLQFAWETLRENSILDQTELHIKQLPITLKCRDCQQEQTIDAPQFKCSNCDSNQLDTINGMELYLDSIEVDN